MFNNLPFFNNQQNENEQKSDILQNIKTHFLSVIKSSRIEFYDYYERNTYMFLTNLYNNSENHKELLTKSKDGMDFMLQEHITLSYITF